uniref:Uncharacterized protein n=1 Tax=Timema cristinae TaxID=61476 RepID=A0A7R9GV17_TIMCR|nr:unnamed protein product [Timema cristinae]
MTSSKSFLWSQVSAGNKDSSAPIDVLQASRDKAPISGSFLWKTQDLSCRRQDQQPAGSKSIHDSGQRVHTQIPKFHFYNRQGGNTSADIYDDVGCRQFRKAPEETYDDVGCRQVGKTPDDTYDDVGCRQLQDTDDDPGFEDEPETSPGDSPISRVEVTPSTRSSATSGLGSSSEHSLVAADHQGDPELYDEVCEDELTEAVNQKSLLINKSMLLFSRESPDQAGKRMMSFREDISSGLQDKTQDIAKRSSVKSLAERFEILSQGRGSTSALPKNTNNTIIKKTFLDHKHCIISSHNSQLRSSSSPPLSSPISGSLAYPEVRKPPSELLPKPHLQPFEFPIFRLPPLPGTPYLTPSRQDVHQGSDSGHSMPQSPSTPSASSSGSSSPTASPPLSPVPPTPPPLSTLPSRSSSRRNNFQPFLRVQEESSENVYELLRGSMELDVYSKEPLYQFYEETSQELAREYICRELESGVEYKPVVPLATTRAVMQQRTLWSQIPEVQESQVIDIHGTTSKARLTAHEPTTSNASALDPVNRKHNRHQPSFLVPKQHSNHSSK